MSESQIWNAVCPAVCVLQTTSLIDSVAQSTLADTDAAEPRLRAPPRRVYQLPRPAERVQSPSGPPQTGNPEQKSASEGEMKSVNGAIR